MEKLTPLVSISTVHNCLRSDVQTQFSQASSDSWIGPGMSAHETIYQGHNGARFVRLVSEDTSLSFVSKAFIWSVLTNKVPRVTVFRPISFSKGFEVDDEVFSKHFPGWGELSCHKIDAVSTKGLIVDSQLYCRLDIKVLAKEDSREAEEKKQGEGKKDKQDAKAQAK